MKKMCAIILTFVLLFSSVGMALAQDVSVERENEHMSSSLSAKREKSEEEGNVEVSIIVELKSDSLLDSPKVKTMGATDYLSTPEAQSDKVSMREQQERVKSRIKAIAPDAEFKYSYVNVLNGFSAKVKVKYLEKISGLREIAELYRSIEYNPPELKDTTSGKMVLPDTYSNMKYRGRKTVVAVVDSGVDVSHELMQLSDENDVKLTKDKIIKALDDNSMQAELSTAGLTADMVYKNPKFPFCYDYCYSDADASTVGSQHGVHVSGIIAANKDAAEEKNMTLHTEYPFNGIAPEAQILGLKVFPDGHGGRSGQEIILAAIEDAITLGADAINLSLGATAGFTDESKSMLGKLNYASLFEKARKSGILISVAAGNENRTGNMNANYYNSPNPLAVNPDDGTVGSPATRPYATAVASVDNTHIITKYLKIGTAEVRFSEAVYPSGYKGDDFVKRLEQLGETEYVRCGHGVIENQDEENPERNDFTAVKDILPGKIAVIERGANYYADKMINAKNYGAKACIIVNTKKEHEVPSCKNTTVDNVIPTVMISAEYAELLPEGGTAKITGNREYIMRFKNSSGSTMSEYSSWGATPDLKLKPEISAPGGDIYSTFTGKYGNMSGTSMAAPHVAGGMASMNEYVSDSPWLSKITDGEERTRVIEAILMSTSRVLKDASDVPYSPRLQGAGFMNLDAAYNDTVYLLNDETGKAKIELKDFTDATRKFSFKLVNKSDQPREYVLSADVLLQNHVIENGRTFIDSTMRRSVGSYVSMTGSGVSGDRVVVPANSETEVDATLTVDQGEIDEQKKIFENGFFVEGFVYLTSNDEYEYPSLSIPYMGFYGDWANLPMFDNFAYKGDIEETGITPYFESTEASCSYVYQHKAAGVDRSGEVSGTKYVAFSPGRPDDQCDEINCTVATFRNIKGLNGYIMDDKGNIVNTEHSAKDGGWKYDNVGKTYVDGALITPLSLDWNGENDFGDMVPEGKYYMVFDVVPDYPNARTQTFKFPVIVDNTKPEVEAYLDEDAGKITIYAKDEHYVDYGVMRIDTVDGENVHYPMFKFVKEGKVDVPTKIFDSSERLLGRTVFVDDAAGNTQSAKINAAQDIPEDIISDISDYQGMYDKASHQLVTLGEKATNAGITATYSVDGGTTFTEEVPTQAEAGEYKVLVRLSGRGYKEKDIEHTAKIAPAQLVIAGYTIEDKTYDGTAKGEVKEVKLSPSYSDELVMGTDYTAALVFEDASVGAGKTAAIEVSLISDKAKRNYLQPAPLAVKANIVQSGGQPVVVDPGQPTVGIPGLPASGSVGLPASGGTVIPSSGDTERIELWILAQIIAIAACGAVVKRKAGVQV